ncbi:hypothetical protein ACFWAP_32805 [Streptomyces goshikiensis]|uniref:hypothetical protein n=1 Tax=Streptomyces goshikiensis TaxID=1942 RepID=UPI0036566340
MARLACPHYHELDPPPWGIGAAVSGVLILATFYWWPLWWLILLVPVALTSGSRWAGRSTPARTST